MHQTSMSFFALWKINFCSLHFETNEVEQFMLTPATSSVSPWSDSGRSPMILKMETQAAKEAYELIANIMEINKHNCTLFLKECIHANCTVVGKCWWNYQNISLLFSFLFLGVGCWCCRNKMNFVCLSFFIENMYV